MAIVNILPNPSASYLPLSGGTLTGDLTIGANKLKTTNLLLKEISTERLGVRNAADTISKQLDCESLFFDTALECNSATGYFSPLNVDGGIIIFRARDTGVGYVETARLVGAADPYFQATLALRLNPIATASLPATPVEGMFVYDDTANKLKVYNGTAWETVTSAVI